MSSVKNEEVGYRHRGIYRSKSKVPRQTLYSRRKKLLPTTCTSDDAVSTELSMSNNCAGSSGVQTTEVLTTSFHNNGETVATSVETETTMTTLANSL